jgi:hypothetical protein
MYYFNTMLFASFPQPHSLELLAESGFHSHGQKYQQHPNNHSKSMRVVEIFGSDSCFWWMTTKGGGGMFLGVFFHEESNGDVILAVQSRLL